MVTKRNSQLPVLREGWVARQRSRCLRDARRDVSADARRISTEAGELPKAFVVPADGELDHDALMAWTARRVAPHKRIRVVETIDAIPKAAIGKILRRVLRDRASAGEGAIR